MVEIRFGGSQSLRSNLVVCSNIRLEASKASKRVVQGTQDRTRGVHKMENKVHKRGEPMKVDFNLKGQDRPIPFEVVPPNFRLIGSS